MKYFPRTMKEKLGEKNNHPLESVNTKKKQHNFFDERFIYLSNWKYLHDIHAVEHFSHTQTKTNTIFFFVDVLVAPYLNLQIVSTRIWNPSYSIHTYTPPTCYFHIVWAPKTNNNKNNIGKRIVFLSLEEMFMYTIHIIIDINQFTW